MFDQSSGRQGALGLSPLPSTGPHVGPGQLATQSSCIFGSIRPSGGCRQGAAHTWPGQELLLERMKHCPPPSDVLSGTHRSPLPRMGRLTSRRVHGLAPGTLALACESSTLRAPCSAGGAPGLRDNAALWDPLPQLTRAPDSRDVTSSGPGPMGRDPPGNKEAGSCRGGNGRGCHRPSAAGPRVGWALELEPSMQRADS